MTEENVGCGSKSRVRESSDPIGSTKTDLSAFLEGMREVHAAMAEELGCPDWTYRDIPWVTSEVWGQLFDIAGEGNCKIVAMSRMGSNCRGQILISPAGMESLHVRAAAAKTALAAALPHLAQSNKSDEERGEVAYIETEQRIARAERDPFAPMRRFVTAVRAEASAAEREAIAKWADTWVNAPVNIADAIRAGATLAERERWTAMPSLARTIEEVRLAEREACAKVADSDASTKGIIIATAIRARKP